MEIKILFEQPSHLVAKNMTLVEGQGIVVGRLVDPAERLDPNTLKFESKVISRKHAQIYFIDDQVRCSD